jgi:hypothetical protein
MLPKQVVRDDFLLERRKALENTGVRPSTDDVTSSRQPLPKQYSRQANQALSLLDGGDADPPLDLEKDSHTSDDDSDAGDHQDDALNQIMRSYKKATQNVNRFAGMMKTQPAPRDIHIRLDPTKVRALVSKLTKKESVAASEKAHIRVVTKKCDLSQNNGIRPSTPFSRSTSYLLTCLTFQCDIFPSNVTFDAFLAGSPCLVKSYLFLVNQGTKVTIVRHEL